MTIHDAMFCSPIPGGYGAACDQFLTKNPQTLTEQQWEALQASWESQGWAIEVTESNALGDMKSELEQLCSRTKCNSATSFTIQNIVEALTRVEKNSKRALKIAKERKE